MVRQRITRPGPRRAACVALLWLLPPALAQQPGADAPDGRINPLATKQEMIRDRLRRLEDRMFRLQQSLAESEPQNAARLARALERIGAAGVDQEVDDLIDLLQDEARLWQASEKQGELLGEFEAVLAVLLQRSDPDARRERIEQLRQFRQEVRQLLDEQRAQRQVTGRATGAAERARKLAGALERIDRLIEEQQARRDAAADPDAANDAAADADAQRRLGERAEQLAEDVRGIAPHQLPPDDAADGARDGANRDPPEAEAAEDLESAASRMRSAAEALEQGEPADAAGEQTEALEQLRRARHRLQAEMDRLDEQQGENDPEQAARAQRSTADKAGDLAQRMQGGRGTEGQQEGRQQPGSSGEPAPGQHNVEQARRHMDDAAKDLEGDRADEATEDQDLAIQELEQARRDLEEELQQLRREERQELLRDLEARFAEMLTRQRAVNAGTTAIAERAGGEADAPAGRADRLRVAELAGEQRDLAAAAGTCLHILEEEGTTVVFPRVVDQIRDDMSAVADRLDRARIGPVTRAVQVEIVAALEDIIEAVRRMQEEQDQQQQQQAGSPQNGEAPLLPGSAELKLLRAAQVRVKTRTTAVDEARRTGAEPPAELNRSLDQIARRQREVADIAREMRDRVEEQ